MMQMLFKLAILEGEGLGTGYEYYVKYRLLNRLLRGFTPKSVLIYGLPEKYGYSMDFFRLARKWGAKVFILEKRMVKLRKCLDMINELGWEMPQIVRKVQKEYDLILSCEVLQSVNKQRYANTVQRYSKRAIVFVPNADNKGHSKISGLKSMTLRELEELFSAKGGYVDMPPFPPGARSKSKKRQFLIWPLEIYGKLEQYLLFKKKCAHICYMDWCLEKK